MPVDESVYEVVSALTQDLLAARDSAGKSALLSRLVELVKDVSLEVCLTCIRWLSPFTLFFSL